MQPTETPFDDQFYAVMQPGMRRSAETLVPIALELLAPRSVVDVGCGRGAWLKVFAEHGVEDVLGIDGEHTDLGKLEIPRDRFLAADLTVSLRLDRRFDLAISLEVAEHLPESSAETFIDTLASLAPAIVFSAAIPRQSEGPGHVNEQWPAYWAERFDRHGYRCIDCIRPRLWERDEVQVWYVQNTLLYVTDEVLAVSEALQAEHRCRGGIPMPIVHPRMWERQRLRKQIEELKRENKRLRSGRS